MTHCDILNLKGAQTKRQHSKYLEPKVLKKTADTGPEKVGLQQQEWSESGMSFDRFSDTWSKTATRRSLQSARIIAKLSF
ncbi:hypothetical protein CBX98_15295 [Vibrio sp. T9]|nr:hypothetical protein CBX98_15295 [Vibrio sp. T9]